MASADLEMPQKRTGGQLTIHASESNAGGNGDKPSRHPA
jgi:hypothetical protein